LSLDKHQGFILRKEAHFKNRRLVMKKSKKLSILRLAYDCLNFLAFIALIGLSIYGLIGVFSNNATVVAFSVLLIPFVLIFSVITDVLLFYRQTLYSNMFFCGRVARALYVWRCLKKIKEADIGAAS
jgi:hypothetical protein